MASDLPAARRSTGSQLRHLLWSLFLAGLLLQLLFVVRAWRAWPSYPEMKGNIVARDSLQFSGLIRPFLEEPQFVSSWKKSGTGTDLPGVLLPFLWGAPAFLTHDIRSGVLVVVLFHLAGGLLLVRTLRRALGDRFTVIYLVIFWLSPWHLFHSGFIWEPNLLLLPAAVHLWSCHVLRDAARPLASFALGATLVLTLQVHYSAFFLIFLTGLLLLKRAVTISWVPFLGGGLAGGLPLLPAMIAILHGTHLDFSSESGFAGRGFVYVLPVLRALLFWARLGSLDVGRMYSGDCVSCVRASLDGSTIDVVRCLVYRLSGFLASASVLLSLAALWWWLRRSREPDRPEQERWMTIYAMSALFALLFAAGVAPITLQTWHVVIAAPAACLPVALWIAARWPFERRWLQALVVAFLLARLPLAGLMAFEYPGFCLVPEAVARKVQD